MEVQEFLETTEPLAKFSEWLSEAKKTNLKMPEAFTLSTLATDGSIHSRVLLLKEIRTNVSVMSTSGTTSTAEVGLVFFTNYLSQKGQDLERAPRAAMNFYWDPLFRQVHFWGAVKKISRQESEAYWRTRPRASQLSQWVSQQSKPVTSRKQLEGEWAQAEQQFVGQEVPCPPHWGGYVLTPLKVEFWIGREGRFHDRFTYRLVENQWLGERLYP